MSLPEPSDSHIYVVRAELGDPGCEDEWNRWYDRHHVPDMLGVPGFNAAARFQERDAERRYLALYDVDGPAVFDTTVYRETAGWGEWEPAIAGWTRALYRRVPLPPS